MPVFQILTVLAVFVFVISVPASLFAFAWFLTRDAGNDSGGQAPTILPHHRGGSRGRR